MGKRLWVSDLIDLPVEDIYMPAGSLQQGDSIDVGGVEVFITHRPQIRESTISLMGESADNVLYGLVLSQSVWVKFKGRNTDALFD